MRRAAAVLFPALLLLAPALARHETGPEAAPPAAGHGNAPAGEARDMTPWKWVNFVLLGAGLGYLIAKQAPPFFRSRSEEIRKDIAEARRLKEEAEARAAAMEARMANLQAEIDRLRAAASEELAAEGERARAETARELAKIEALAGQEIASVAKAARGELKALAARLALALAEEKIRAGMNPASHGALVDNFVQGLGRKSPGREVN